MRFQPLLRIEAGPGNDEMSHLTWLIGNRMVDRADFERHTFCDGFLQPTPKLQLHKKVTADKTLGPLGVMITKAQGR